MWERIADTTCVIGENPLWHPTEESLYWIDIPEGELFRYDPETDEHAVVYETEVIGGFSIERDGALLLFEGGGRVERWADGEIETVRRSVRGEEATRFNDVIADPAGRVFCGTMPTEDKLGSLYQLKPDGSVTRLLDGVETPNGMGFSPSLDRFYFSDSKGHTIYSFSYDRETGSLDDRRTIVETPPDGGEPDGMTVDRAGNLWSAHWNGGCLVSYTPEGVERRRIEFPARKVTSVTFGGAAYDTMYVTTAGGDNREAEGRGAGAVYRLQTDAIGVPEFRSHLSSTATESVSESTA